MHFLLNKLIENPLTMKIGSFKEKSGEQEIKIRPKLVLESSFSKEIQIVLKQGQKMKEHQTPFPIIVHLLEGEIDFGVNGKNYSLNKDSIIALEGAVPHDLRAKKDSIIRLTISKFDTYERIENVIDDSTHE